MITDDGCSGWYFSICENSIFIQDLQFICLGHLSFDLINEIAAHSEL